MHVGLHACKNAHRTDACKNAYYQNFHCPDVTFGTALNLWRTHVENSSGSELGVHASRYIDITVLISREGNYFLGAPSI